MGVEGRGNSFKLIIARGDQFSLSLPLVFRQKEGLQGRLTVCVEGLCLRALRDPLKRPQIEGIFRGRRSAADAARKRLSLNLSLARFIMDRLAQAQAERMNLSIMKRRSIADLPKT